MGTTEEKIIDTLMDAMNRKTETQAYDTSATVRRIENGIAWVHINGGVDETPVKLTINAAVGDEVQVRVTGGHAFIVGNATSPPTDDKVAEQAVQKVTLMTKVVETVKKVAESAAKIAGNTNQYFWHTETGTDTGAHITEIPKDDFLADPTNGGGNLLARSNGIAVRDGLTELATFGSDGAQIGREDATHMFVSDESQSLVDEFGNSWFDVKAAIERETSTTSSEQTGDGSNTVFSVYLPIAKLFAVVVSGRGTQVEGVDFERIGNAIFFAVAPEAGATVTIYFYPVTQRNAFYTLGTRDESQRKGFLSVAEGMLCEASGSEAHAEGYRTTSSGWASHAEGYGASATGWGAHAEGGSSASGDGSHAEGGRHNGARIPCIASGSSSHAEGLGTLASGDCSHAQNRQTTAGYDAQTAIGKYNDNQSDNAFEIGNGAANAASNALTVDWSGNVVAAGDVQNGSGKKLSDMPVVLYDTTAGWQTSGQAISAENTIYVWTDYQQDEDGNDVAGFKVGDGLAYIIDLPFVDAPMQEHMSDQVVHITQTEREFWNNKERAYVVGENLILTKQ